MSMDGGSNGGRGRRYLFMLFSPSTVVPIDRYIFNTECHPLSPLSGVPLKLHPVPA